jgi:hypothetical protein
VGRSVVSACLLVYVVVWSMLTVRSSIIAISVCMYIGVVFIARLCTFSFIQYSIILSFYLSPRFLRVWHHRAEVVFAPVSLACMLILLLVILLHLATRSSTMTRYLVHERRRCRALLALEIRCTPTRIRLAIEQGEELLILRLGAAVQRCREAEEGDGAVAVPDGEYATRCVDLHAPQRHFAHLRTGDRLVCTLAR